MDENRKHTENFPMNTETPITDLLVELESYNESHLSASSSLKTSIWNLYKARRQRRRNAMTLASAFSAFDIREELRAQITLRCNVNDEEPFLENEGKVSGSGDMFCLQNYHEFATKEDVSGRSKVEKNGIRRRKKKGKDDENEKSLWTKDDNFYEDEEKLVATDPLDLFGGGLAPGDLKIAQKYARESLRSYITAANQAAAVLKITNQLAQLSIEKDA